MTLATMIKQWQIGLAQAREFEDLDPEERKAVARDIGVPEGVLADIVARGPDAGAELPRLIAVLSLNAEKVGRRHAGVMRDMSIVCSGCREVGRCRRDLDRGQAQAAFADYCPNAETLKELQGLDISPT
jgi:hypothetical protein